MTEMRSTTVDHADDQRTPAASLTRPSPPATAVRSFGESRGTDGAPIEIGWLALQRSLAPERAVVVGHPVYRSLPDLDALRIFLEHHVWAVWDFMSLLTRLQQDLTCVSVPWVPRKIDPGIQRLVNEIKLGEESDEHPDGAWCSHFALYLAAMTELGADTGPVRRVVADLARGCAFDDPAQRARVLAGAGAPEGAIEFVESTFAVVAGGSTLSVAAAFALGREQLIPSMFEHLIDGTTGRLLGEYLRRHIEVDEGEHGPLTQRLVEFLAAADPRAWEEVRSTAAGALRARRRLWDAVVSRVAASSRATPDRGGVDGRDR